MKSSRAFSYLGILNVVAAALLLSACAPGFQVQPEMGEAPMQLVTSQGELGWSEASKMPDEVSVSYRMKVPFGRVYKAAAQAIRWAAPLACQFVPGVMTSDPSQYKAGEVPCGRIANESWKQILSLDIDDYETRASGFTVYIYGAKVPVYLARQARQGQYEESNLTERGVVTRTTSKVFGEDVSVRYTPSGSATRLEMCLNIPGSTVTSVPIDVHGKAWTKKLGVKVHYESTINVQPGQASFDYGRGCFAVDFGWTGETLAPNIAFQATQVPYLANVEYDGLHLKIKDWFLRLIDNVLDFFHSSIRKSVVRQIEKMANKMGDSEIESGRWFARVHGETLLNNAGEKINKRVAKIMNRIGIPATASDLRTLLRDQCRFQKLALEATYTDAMNTFCRDVIDHVQIEIEPFAVDAKSKALGCYDHFARLGDAKLSPWWTQQCKFAANFRVSLAIDFKGYVQQLQTLLARALSENPIPEEWRELAQQNGLDEYLLSLATEELEKKGFDKVNVEDLRAQLPGLIEALNARLAKDI